MNLVLKKYPGMKKDSSEYEYAVEFVGGLGQRPMDSVKVRGDANLHQILTSHLDQSEGDVARLMASLNRSPDSAVEVVADLKIEGASVQPNQVPLLVRNIELERRAAK